MRQRAVDRKCVVINLNQCYGIANVLLQQYTTYYDEYNRACNPSLCLSSSAILFSICWRMLPSVAIDITPRALAIAASVFLSSAWTCGLGGGSAVAAAAFARIGSCCNVAIADTIVEPCTGTGGTGGCS